MAFGRRSVEVIRRWASAAPGGPAVTTARTPRRASELVGGSVFWIVAHQLVARQAILGLAPRDSAPGVTIALDREVVDVEPCRWRAHQGWRYLEARNAPPDLAGGAGEAALMAELRALALVD